MASSNPIIVRSRQHGQSTVEFMLMVPVLFAILFFVIEMGLYFTTVHYGTYAAYTAARSQQVAFNTTYTSVQDVSGLVMTGQIWEGGTAVSVSGGSGARVDIANFQKKVPFPFLRNLLPDLTFSTQVNLGTDESALEGCDNMLPDQYDNNI